MLDNNFPNLVDERPVVCGERGCPLHHPEEECSPNEEPPPRPVDVAVSVAANKVDLSRAGLVGVHHAGSDGDHHVLNLRWEIRQRYGLFQKGERDVFINLHYIEKSSS